MMRKFNYGGFYLVFISFVERDECENATCSDNGDNYVCKDGVNGFQCVCDEGYTGDNCDSGKCYINL